MPLPLLFVLVFAAAYLVGSFPTGILVTRARGIDLRQVGSGNTGATNVGRAMGKKWAVVVLVVDAGKGWAMVVLARYLAAALAPESPVFAAGPWLEATAGFGAVVGHSYSLFLRGRGGKGVATSLGAALGISPPAALASAALYLLLYLLLRISSVGSLAGVCAFPLFLWLLGPTLPAYVTYGIVTAVLVVMRHEDNLKRLIRGEELKA